MGPLWGYANLHHSQPSLECQACWHLLWHPGGNSFKRIYLYGSFRIAITAGVWKVLVMLVLLRLPFIGVLFSLLSVLLGLYTGILIKKLGADVTLVTTLFYRFLLSLPFLLAFAFWRHSDRYLEPSTQNVRMYKTCTLHISGPYNSPPPLKKWAELIDYSMDCCLFGSILIEND